MTGNAAGRRPRVTASCIAALLALILAFSLCGCAADLPISFLSQKSSKPEETAEIVEPGEQAEPAEEAGDASAGEEAAAEDLSEEGVQEAPPDDVAETEVVAADVLTPEEMTEQPAETRPLKLRIGDKEVKVEWENNDAVTALKQFVADEPFVIPTALFGGFEQIGSLGKHFPTDDKEITAQPGDIMLYYGNQLAVFFGEYTWEYTRLGKIKGMDEEALSGLLGQDEMEITLYLSDRTDETKRILCYGDSNTFGYDPSSGSTDPNEKRYDESVRWTSLLSEKLGEDYTVIEAGYNGRTIASDTGDKMQNGMKALGDTIAENKPVDVLLVMLGTNDCYLEEITSAQEIRDNMQAFLENAVEVCREKQGFAPDILLITPPGSETPKNEDGSANVDENMDAAQIYRLQAGIQMTYQLAPLYEALAWDVGCYYLNGADLAVSSVDGVHLTEEGHADLAERLYDKLVNYMGE